MSKTIVIIGAGPGVGLAVARRFGAEGYKVALLARDKERLEELVAQLKSEGIEAASFPVNVLDDNLKNTLEDVKAHFGRIDVLEFGVGVRMDLMRKPREMDIENISYFIDLNILSVVTAVQAVLPEMLERKSGSILFTLPPSAKKPIMFAGGFSVTGGALVHYIEMLHKDLAQDHIFVGVVYISGSVYTTDQAPTKAPAHLPEGIPFVSAKEVAQAHWDLHTKKEGYEAFTGDWDKIYSLPGFN
ncbi:SDR family oxidoreductase [Mucilaginibacter gossypii]|uniref:NADP-dependent 3-hydroxy acid dehydrogenase YdfG n=1 Tax=Mucilaginibacter gossypii TaxID=551996 RepID=A0A1G8CQV8_9SPHI|nr:SDR family NAD(P)-dependent oxidoreductase [Mucilaginibacter gossypii]SDH47816.1 NADP-dependent 3-hydroxy acid dehydrogenase YdfG [Mucilaginibacter gossypii]